MKLFPVPNIYISFTTQEDKMFLLVAGWTPPHCSYRGSSFVMLLSEGRLYPSDARWYWLFRDDISSWFWTLVAYNQMASCESSSEGASHRGFRDCQVPKLERSSITNDTGHINRWASQGSSWVLGDDSGFRQPRVVQGSLPGRSLWVLLFLFTCRIRFVLSQTWLTLTKSMKKYTNNYN